MKKIILLTGFEPFNQETINPSWEAVRSLQGWHEGDFVVHARLLPCVFGHANKVMHQAVEELQPSIVIAVGQAGGRVDLSVERIAINIDDAPIADNQMRQIVDQPIVTGGPAAYFSTLPIKAIVQALRLAGLPASVSNTAGTFVCNHSFYALMHLLATRPTLAHTRGGFVHVPCLPEQAARQPALPSMALATQIEALRVLLHAALTTHADIAMGDGQEH